VQHKNTLALHHFEDMADVGMLHLAIRVYHLLFVDLLIQLSGHDGKILLIVGAYATVEQLIPLMLEEHISRHIHDLHSQDSDLKKHLKEIMALA